MIIDINGKRCKCGNFGCIESYSSIKSIILKFSEEVSKGRHTNINKPVEDINYKDICLAAEEEDALAKEIITEAALILGTGLASVL